MDARRNSRLSGLTFYGKEEMPMPRRKSRTLTEVELEFMQVVWDRETVTTEAVLDALRGQGRDLADGSVRKILSILVDKGYLSREQEGRGFRYRAEVPRENATRSMVTDLLDRAFGGSAALMVASLLDVRTVTGTDLSKIKKLIAEREQAQ